MTTYTKTNYFRIPAHCSGIAALKPTTGRIYEGK